MVRQGVKQQIVVLQVQWTGVRCGQCKHVDSANTCGQCKHVDGSLEKAGAATVAPGYLQLVKIAELG